MSDPILDGEGAQRSIWHATTEFPTLQPLEGDAHCDVLVIGAGSGGLLGAYLLACASKDVLVVDGAPTVAGGESGRTTGHLNNYPDEGLSVFLKNHGEDGLRLFHQSHSAAIDLIEKIIRDENIDCGFERVPEYQFVAPDGEGHAYLDEQLQAAHKIGWTDVHFEKSPKLALQAGACLVYPNQAHYDAGRFFAGLARAIEKHGGRLRRAHVTDMAASDADFAETDRGRISCNALVTATNSPINPLMIDLPVIHARQFPYRTFALALELEPDSIEHAQWSDTLDPYHYVRVQRLADGRDVLIVGGEDHKTAHANDGAQRLDRLEKWARERWPAAGKRMAAWSGQVMETPDDAGLLGHNPGDHEHSCIITGDSGQGLTHTAIGAMITRDRLLGRDNSFADFFDPKRQPISWPAAKALAAENVDVAAQYADYLTGGEIKSRDDLVNGMGGVLREGLRKIAVYRADDGTLHEHSAVCPHLGCIVAWNGLEKSFDCPCHGGRYAPTDGRVLNGPALSGLTPADE